MMPHAAHPVGRQFGGYSYRAGRSGKIVQHNLEPQSQNLFPRNSSRLYLRSELLSP
jgi:hypothetical protein